jgi:hypothetical protein
MLMTETKNQVTVLKIVRHLHKELSDLAVMDTLSPEQEYRLTSIGRTVEVLIQLASDVSDRKLWEVLDDFEYGVNETSMGAAGKAARALTKTEAKIQALENEYHDQ